MKPLLKLKNYQGESMSRSKNFKAEPFVNMFGQTLNPGDDVVYVGTSWQNTTFKKGKYAGVYYGRPWYELNEPLKVMALKIDNIADKRYDWSNTIKTGVWIDVVRTAYLP